LQSVVDGGDDALPRALNLRQPLLAFGQKAINEAPAAAHLLAIGSQDSLRLKAV
jgi:hypothetical protein